LNFGSARFARSPKSKQSKQPGNMTRTQRTLLVTAAIAGLMTGGIVKTLAQTNSPGTNAPSGDTGKHDCAGKNSCKGQGGCGSSKGKNSCKGQGGCNTKGSCKSV
jgi:hypothetical protein